MEGLRIFIILLIFLLFIPISQSQSMSSSTYDSQIIRDSGGGDSTSTTYDGVLSISQTVIGNIYSATYDNYLGFFNAIVSAASAAGNSAPASPTLVLNSSSATNYTDENLTVYISGSSDGDDVTNITDWRLNGTSIVVLNMPFDTNDSSTAKDYSTFENNGTINGAEWNASGKVGGTYTFDGVNDSINFKDTQSLSLTNNKFSFSTWISLSETSKINSILSKGSYSLKIGSDNRPYLELINSTINPTWTDTGSLVGDINVYSLAVYNGSLYGGVGTSGNVYIYDGGTTWTSVGSLGSSTWTYALTVYNGS